MSIQGPGILWRLRAGGSTPGLANANTSPGAYFKRNGTVGFPANNLLRTSWWDIARDGVLETPTYLIEPGATNSLLQSQTPATAPWSSATLTVTNAAGTAPDGTTTAATMIPTAVNSADHHAEQSMTTTASEFLSVSGFFKASGYSGIRLLAADAGGNQIGWAFDLTGNGAVGNATTTGTGVNGISFIYPLGSGWYYCGITGKVGTATTIKWYLQVFQNLAGANSGAAYVGNGASGILMWGGQFERNGTTTVTIAPTSYVKTTTVTVTRNTDGVSATFPYRPVAMTLYVKYISRGTLPANDAALLMISSAAAVQPFALLGLSATTGVAKMRHDESSSVTATAGSLPTYGQSVEIRGVLNADGSVLVGQSIAGGAETISAASGALALSTAWSAQLIGIPPSAGAAPQGLENALVLSGVRSLQVCQGLL